MTGQAWPGDLTRGLTITGGGNALAKLKLERARDRIAGDGLLTLLVSLAQTRDLKGYGFSLEYDPAKYEFVEAREANGSLLKSGTGQETLFLASDRTPGRVDIGAVRVDGEGVSGNGTLVELVFQASETPAASDFQISESVLIGMDGSIDLLSHVEIGDLNPLPDRFELKQNMPNPFNPSTVIGYQLAEAGPVRLAIYSVLGQEVRVLVDERHEAGGFTATWDGTDDLGRRVASGIYLYRLEAGDFTAARRMLLLK
ncbi:MAG: T9SS type A sorting domain-containing protein [Gemmatimonadota bacterium]|nr:T9SS type A sorting domain-containing protein [Gemmatimonadota bacterium]